MVTQLSPLGRAPMKLPLLPGIIVALLQTLCPLGLAGCFLFWFPRLLESVLLQLLSYGLGAFFLAGAALVVFVYVPRSKRASQRESGASDDTTA